MNIWFGRRLRILAWHAYRSMSRADQRRAKAQRKQQLASAQAAQQRQTSKAHATYQQARYVAPREAEPEIDWAAIYDAWEPPQEKPEMVKKRQGADSVYFPGLSGNRSRREEDHPRCTN